MVKQIFVNLPVKDLEKTKAFWDELGFSFNPQFTDEKGAALVLGENIFVMCLTEEFFKTFIKKELADSQKVREVINAIGVETKDQVNQIVDKAVEAGGVENEEPKDYGWMYYRSFEDLDGHHWEVTFIDQDAIPENPSESEVK
jgi:uncharacterized protein